MSALFRCSIIVGTIVLQACGGGGSSDSKNPGANSSAPVSSAAAIISSSSISSSKAPAPSIIILNTEQKIQIGERGKIEYTSTNANSCSEATSGSVATSGTLEIQPIKGGQVTYTITCTGDGGSAFQSALVMTPYPVYKTSYENKVNVELDTYIIPTNGAWPLNVIAGPVNEEWTNSPSINGLKNIHSFSPRSIAFADFLNNGTMVAIVSNTTFYNIYPEANKNNSPDSPGKLYFVQLDPITKKWTDISAQLFKSDTDRTSVVSPGFLQVADLNNDNKPDVYLAGWGSDFPLLNNDWSVLKSDSYVVLSQPDGSYKKFVLPINKFFAHQSSLADINGDGNIDIITANNDFTEPKHYLQKPMVLWGYGNGTFSVPDETVFPDDTTNKGIFGLTVIPIDGTLNVLLSGGNPNSLIDQWAPSIYGTKVLQFIDGRFQVVQDLTSSIPKIPGSDLNFEFVINAGFYNNQWVFLLESPALVKDEDGNYINGALYKMDKDGTNVLPISKTFSGYGAEMLITNKGHVMAMSGSCSLSDPNSKYYCGLDIQLAAINSSSSSSILSTSSSTLSSSGSILPSSSSSSSSSKKLDPIITEKTSYLNKLKMGDPNHGKTYTMIAEGVTDSAGVQRPLAYGDFFQDGTIAAFTTDLVDNSGKTAPEWRAGTIHFFHRSADGKGWADKTTSLLKDFAGCIALKKASVADFNGDGKPDLYLGCTGADVAGSVGENQRILLSQADGTYINNVLPLICYCHASAAGDIDGDGNVDIVTYDNLTIDNPTNPEQSHYWHAIAYMGSGDGMFTSDDSRFPDSLINRSIWTFDLIDTGRGMLDLFIGGNGYDPKYDRNSWSFTNSIIINDGGGNFTSAPIVLDNTAGKTFYGLALDFVIKDGWIYIGQVGDEYKSNAVRKVNLVDPTQSELLYEHEGVAGFPWITLLNDGHIATMCDYSNTVDSWCNWTEH